MNTFNRDQMIDQIKIPREWDLIVIGGGATGLGIALDAACRGYSVVLLEQSDFAKATSSRSTKLIHGGVRYLAQGNVPLVHDAVQERGLLLRNAPHLVKKQAFVIPCYNWFSVFQYFTGLKIYDWLAGSYSLGSSKFVTKREVLQHLPAIKSSGLVGGIKYFDAQFDDARMALNLAQTCAEKGGVILNYFKVTGLLKTDQKVCGVIAIDQESDKEYQLQAKVVINATGVFVDDILTMDHPESKPLVRPSQGVHLVLQRSFLNTDTALLIPKTADGRVLFAVPWHDHMLVGTTDTPINETLLEPIALEQEIGFILDTMQKYLSRSPERKDVLSVFAGLRPLAAQNGKNNTKEISRDHKLFVSDSGLITITGGKWTTYRKMAEETVDMAIITGNLVPVACRTKGVQIHGFTTSLCESHLGVYGSDAEQIKELTGKNPALNNTLVNSLPYTEAEVVWAVRNEMARTVEDVLARRLRILFLDASAAMKAAAGVAKIMAKELQYDKDWESSQVENFTRLAKQYLFPNNNLTNEFAQLHLSA
ncbi:glycerol-3-phosphate dehydrogenase/oxidase [Chitinophagaceae bacterium LB-8]|uniref:Glycerol-3-phosphate dehydrogenase/oxidase n=1 Tax=Paraflavisolibacter caeni TaxID=2982496 RepID=A0A9X2XWT8_9BACT|nr:glycerol-3-phosphate dehydrogenase/oxidase [Paraflavisolibacter caeni]MCU7550156.1 glycerol-3-phosphate dehydrogenase/oxidase [Paraflavisolibacter caeni]